MTSFIGMNTVASKSQEAVESLTHYYFCDERPFCVAYSGGKDSTALIYLIFEMLVELRKKNSSIDKPVYVITSNTLAELPPMLKHMKESIENIRNHAKQNNLPVFPIEVTPDWKHTLNVQLLGVGMPPPSSSFRWCTDKLKIQPIEKEILKLFPDGRFLTITGARSDESHERAKRLKAFDGKIHSLHKNDRYQNSDVLHPLENWNTKEVWEYLFLQTQQIVDVQKLWSLYSDASGKDALECSFVAAGGVHIDEKRIGCGTSRFGCWQCYVTRDHDRCLDGLLKSGHKNIEKYKKYRDFFWSMTQQGWEKTRDVYSHSTQRRDTYNKGEGENPLYGATMPKGLRLTIRQKAFRSFLELQHQCGEELITSEEIVLIQKRWLMEGDLELKAFAMARKYGIEIPMGCRRPLIREAKNSKKFYMDHLYDLKSEYSILTLKRFAYQYVHNKSRSKLSKMFFPSKKEEKHIRKEWKRKQRMDSAEYAAASGKSLFEIVEGILNEKKRSTPHCHISGRFKRRMQAGFF